MKILIITIPHKEQRYPTCGDWVVTGPGEIAIRVSEEVGDIRSQSLVAVHELVEVLLCAEQGITAESVDRFDKAFEETRHPDNHDEPGDDPEAPYHKEHCFATGIERLLAAALNVKWKEYEGRIDAL